MTDYRSLIEDTVAAVHIDAAGECRWLDQPIGELPARIRAKMSPSSFKDYLVHLLQSTLYERMYCHGVVTPHESIPAMPASRSDAFLESLIVANPGRGSEDPGWTVVDVDDGTVVVEKDGLKLWARREEIVAVPDPLLRGDEIAVRLPKDLLKVSPGYYMVLGDKGIDPRGSSVILRFYFNVKRNAAAALLAGVTRRLNDAGLAFRLKVVDDPALFGRCDAAVLYVHRRDFSEVGAVVSTTYGEIMTSVRPRTPAFTKALAPGLGFAEEPPDHASFGMHRCRLVAEGLVNAYVCGAHDSASRVRAVGDRFQAAGISLERPYLNPGSSNGYSVEIAS